MYKWSSCFCSCSLQQWHDPWLSWDASKYNGLSSINISPNLVWKPDIVLHNKWVVIQSFPTFNSFPQTPLSGLRVKDGKRKGKSPQNSWNKILGSDRWVPIWTVRSSLKSNFSWVSKDIHVCIDLLRHALWLVQKIRATPSTNQIKGKTSSHLITSVFPTPLIGDYDYTALPWVVFTLRKSKALITLCIWAISKQDL